MVRPSKPLITRAGAVEASIEIIDAEGLDAFSVLRLARHLGVQAPSLYHHFADKNEILAAIARDIGGRSVLKPRWVVGVDWPEYFVALGLNFRQSVLRHRNAAPVLVEYLPRESLVGSFEDAARFLHDLGIPAHLRIQILDGVETICIGAVLTEAVRDRQDLFPDADVAGHPHLAEALAANELTVQEMFAERIRSFLHGLMSERGGPPGLGGRPTGPVPR